MHMLPSAFTKAESPPHWSFYCREFLLRSSCYHSSRVQGGCDHENISKIEPWTLRTWNATHIKANLHTGDRLLNGPTETDFTSSGRVSGWAVQSADAIGTILCNKIISLLSSTSRPLHTHHKYNYVSYRSTTRNPITTSAGKIGQCVQKGKKKKSSRGSEEEMPYFLEIFCIFLTSPHWLDYFSLEVRKSKAEM